VLGHIGLGRCNLSQQIGDILFTVTQAADDLQSHGGGHDPKHFRRFVKDVVWLVQFGWFLLGSASRHGEYADLTKGLVKSFRSKV
jgi:hypothetical protein